MAKTEATIEELVSMIERGKLRLPEMQRRYVWHLAAYKIFLVERRKRVAMRLNEFLGCGYAV